MKTNSKAKKQRESEREEDEAEEEEEEEHSGVRLKTPTKTPTWVEGFGGDFYSIPIEKQDYAQTVLHIYTLLRTGVYPQVSRFN